MGTSGTDRPDLDRLAQCVRQALAEDLGAAGDVTSTVAVPAERRGTARIVAREAGVLAGIDAVHLTFAAVDDDVRVDVERRDGDSLEPGDVVCTMHGRARSLLAGERVALNFLQRLSGVATQARAFQAAVEGTGAVVLETRKTTPGWRTLEKYAVRVGGGKNHRIGLFDQVLLKENHFALAVPRTYREVVEAAVAADLDAPVIAEARTVDEAKEAVAGGAGVVMLDNFEPGPPLAQAVERVRAFAAELGRTVAIEASGGVTLKTVRAFAESGVDRISVGALTHSVPSLDLSMLVEGLE